MSAILHDPVGWGVIALIIGYLVFILPWRRRYTIVTSRSFRAIPDAVWAQLRTPPPNIISQALDPSDPHVTVVTTKHAWNGAMVTSKLRVLLLEPQQQVVIRFEQIDDKAFPYGEDGTLTELLQPRPNGTRVALAFDGMLNSSVAALKMRWIQRSALAKVSKGLSEARAVPKADEA